MKEYTLLLLSSMETVGATGSETCVGIISEGTALKKSITTTHDSTLITKSRQLKSTDVDLCT